MTDQPDTRYGTGRHPVDGGATVEGCTATIARLEGELETAPPMRAGQLAARLSIERRRLARLTPTPTDPTPEENPA